MSDIIECTKGNPWDKGPLNGARVRHHETREVGDQENGWPGGDVITNQCINCGARWREELAQ